MLGRVPARLSLRLARLGDSTAAALAWRYLCHALMLLPALLNERLPAPPLPDRVVDAIPRVAWIAEHNYHLWLAAYLPVALWLWRRDREEFRRFLWLGGVLSLLRGLTIPLTGLGPVEGPDMNAGLPAATLLAAWVDLVNPWTALTGRAAHVYLTKDLFFSGHASSTFLLWLHARKRAVLGPVALAAHLAVVAIIFLSHLHYAIDVVGAWAITLALWAPLELRRRGRPGADAPAPSRRRPAPTSRR